MVRNCKCQSITIFISMKHIVAILIVFQPVVNAMGNLFYHLTEVCSLESMNEYIFISRKFSFSSHYIISHASVQSSWTSRTSDSHMPFNIGIYATCVLPTVQDTFVLVLYFQCRVFKQLYLSTSAFIFFAFNPSLEDRLLTVSQTPVRCLRFGMVSDWHRS